LPDITKYSGKRISLEKDLGLCRGCSRDAKARCEPQHGHTEERKADDDVITLTEIFERSGKRRAGNNRDKGPKFEIAVCSRELFLVNNFWNDSVLRRTQRSAVKRHQK